MKKYCLLLMVFLPLISIMAQVSPNYKDYPAYTGTDLGCIYTPKATQCKVWSPVADAMRLRLYKNGIGGEAVEVLEMTKSVNGVWIIQLAGDRKGWFYTVQAQINGQWMDEVTDPYAKAAGTNGKRAMIVDLKSTYPKGWQTDPVPSAIPTNAAVVYELHVRDATINASGKLPFKGTFLGLAATAKVLANGQAIGIAYMKTLGITHVHLLPVFDFNSVDESKPNMPQYNWGYDPLNYNLPEGSYSTNPSDGAARIREFKTLVLALHKAGIRVVMDVVYNHTGVTEKHPFNQLVPGYYYRQNETGGWSNGAACDNETASERPMFRKFMIESLTYWVKEYHIDGFRFDLMGLHDITTMNLISKTLTSIKPGMLLYGEGWTAGKTPLAPQDQAIKANAAKLQGVAVFSDDLRDGTKGSVFNHNESGFATGNALLEQSVRFGIVAACAHPQVNLEKVNYSKSPYATAPSQVMSYVSCHDNHTLWDRINTSNGNEPIEVRRQMHKLSLGIVFTAQGVAFLHAGCEWYRSKKGVENSYNAGDSINAIDWEQPIVHQQQVQYMQHLIAMRKNHKAFQLTSQTEVAANIQFKEGLPEGIIAFTINGAAVGDFWKKVVVIYNGGAIPQDFTLDGKEMNFTVRNNAIGNGLSGNKFDLAPYSMNVLYQ